MKSRIESMSDAKLAGVVDAYLYGEMGQGNDRKCVVIPQLWAVRHGRMTRDEMESLAKESGQAGMDC